LAYTDSELIKACKDNITFKGVVNALGGSYGGWWLAQVKESIDRVGVDISHFDSKKASRDNMRRVGMNTRMPWQMALVKRTSGQRRSGKFLRDKMDEAGIPNTCGRCPVDKLWNGNKLRLEVHHKNGDWLDDRIENLERLCPNCHSQDEYSSHKST